MNTLADKSPIAFAQASETASANVIEAMKAAIATDTSKAINSAVESSLRQQFVTEFGRLYPLPPRVQVLVVSAQLKDLGPTQNLTRIRLSVTEEGVEWAQTRASDTTSQTLLPE
jgi:type II secretory pathway component PulM